MRIGGTHKDTKKDAASIAASFVFSESIESVKSVEKYPRFNKKRNDGEGSMDEVGDGLLSQRVTPRLPSTLVGLTAGFEKGPGVPPPLLSPTTELLPLPSLLTREVIFFLRSQVFLIR
jgi:hypothetical protein